MMEIHLVAMRKNAYFTGKWIELEIMLNEIRRRKANVACFLSYVESIFKYMYIFTCMYIHMFNTYYMFEMKLVSMRRRMDLTGRGGRSKTG